MCIFTPWGILPRNHHRRKPNKTTKPTISTSISSPTYAPRLVHIQPQKHSQSLNYPAPKSKPLSINTRQHHLSTETQPLLSNSHSRSPPLHTRTSPTSPTYPSHQLRIRHLTAQLLQRQTLETRRDVLASLANRYHDVPEPSPSSPPRRRRRATISPPLSSVASSSSNSSRSSTEGWDSPVRGRGRGRRGSVSTPATSVSLGSSEGQQGGVGIGGHGIGNGNGNDTGNGAGVNGYGYTLPFVQAPQLPLFGAASSSSVGGSTEEGSEASTVSEYWTNGRGVGGGWRYLNDSAPVGSRRVGGGVVDSWVEGRRRGNWDRGGGVGYATMGGLREARERTERGLGRLEGEIGRARAGVGGGVYRLWNWE